MAGLVESEVGVSRPLFGRTVCVGWLKVDSLREVSGFEWAVHGLSLDDEANDTPASGGIQTVGFSVSRCNRNAKRHREDTVRIKKVNGSRYGCG